MPKFLWDDVAESKEFKEAGIVQRRAIKEAFFNQVIAPTSPFPASNLDYLRQTFLAEEDKIPLPPSSVELEQAEEKGRAFSPFLGGVVATAAKAIPRGLSYKDVAGDLGTAALGAAHTVASALEPATFGIAPKVGLGKEGLEYVLKKRGVSEEALFASRLGGELAGYGVVLPAIIQYGGGALFTKGLEKAPAISKFLPSAVKWALAGFEHGALSEEVNVAFDRARSENVPFASEMQRVGISGGKEAALFATMELAIGGLGIGGEAFLKTSTGRQLVRAAKRLWENPLPDIDVSKLYSAYRNVPGLLVEPKPEPVPGFAQTAEARITAQEAAIEARKPRIVLPENPAVPDAQVIIPGQVTKNPDILVDTVNRWVRTPQRHARLQKLITSKVEKAAPTKAIAELSPVIAKSPAELAAPSFVLEAMPRGLAETKTPIGQPRPTVARRPVSPKFDVEAVLARGREAKEKAPELMFKNSSEAIEYGFSIARDPKAQRKLASSLAKVESEIQSLQAAKERGFLTSKGDQKLMNLLSNKSMIDEAYDVATAPNPEATRAAFLLEKNPSPKNAKIVLFNPDYQSKAVIEKASKLMSEATKAEPIENPKDWISKLREASRSKGQQHAVVYKSGDKVIYSAFSTQEMNLIKDSLTAGKSTVDLSGNKITEWILNRVLGKPDEFLLNEKGVINFGAFIDSQKALADLGVKLSDRFPEPFQAKQLSLPFSVARKYPEFRKIFDAINNQVNSRNEQFVIGWDLMQDRLFPKLAKASKEKIAKSLWFGNSPKGRTYLSSGERKISLGGDAPRYYTEGELQTMFELTPEEAKIASSVIKTQQYATSVMKEVFKERLGYYDPEISPAEQQAITKAVDRSVERLWGYFHNRRSGEWVASIYDKEGKIIWNNRFSKQADAKKAVESVASSLGATKDQVVVENYPTISKRTIRNLSYDNLIELAMESKRGVSEDAKEALDEALSLMKTELRRQKRDYFFIHRNDIPGFDETFENLTDSVFSYLERAVNNLSMIRARRSAIAALREIDPRISPSLYSIGQQYIENYFATGIATWPVLQKAIYHNGLAFNLGSAIVNLTQNFTMTIPEISKYYGKGIDAEVAFTKALKSAFDYAQTRLLKKQFKGDRELFIHLNTLSRRGQLGGRQIRYLTGESELRKPTTKQAEKVKRTYFDLAEAPMKYTEEFNRTVAATSAYDIAKTQLGLRGREVLDFMSKFIDSSQGVYGKQNIPVAITGAGNLRPFVRSVYTYGTFWQHYLSWLLHAHEEGAAKAMRAYLYLGGISGVTGIPLISQVLKMAGIDLGQEIRDIGSKLDLPKEVTDIVVKGLPTLTGVDLSRSVGFGDVLPRSFGISDITRAPGRMVQNLVQFAELIQMGENWKALSKFPLIPRAAAQAFKALDYAKQGITNFKGEQLTGGATNRLSAKDLALTALGIPALKITDVYDAENIRKFMEERHAKKTSELNSKLARFLARKDHKGYIEELQRNLKRNQQLPVEERIVPNQDEIHKQRLMLLGIRTTSAKSSSRLKGRIKEVQESLGLVK